MISTAFYHIIVAMKKVLLLLVIGFMVSGICAESAHAGIISTWKENAAVRKELKNTEKEIKACFELQIKYSNEHNWDKLKEFYADKYRNSDAFDKNTTFKIIKENYETYPDLKMALQINMLDVNGDFATVDVYEYAEAHDIKRDDLEDLTGNLEAFAHTIYFLEKIDGKWLITAEQAIEENNSIIFGEAKYLDLKLTAPMIVGAGESYSSTLSINNLPRQALVMGAITQSPAVFPLKEDEESYRVLEDVELERIFTANKDNINEYNIASIGITRGQPIPDGAVKLYMSGLAFMMTRVNVIPENKFFRPADNDDDDGENDDKD